ncbi:hypothetical protein ACIPLA_07800 [Pseudomonas sp. NPDC086112]|uniref:hypothetical protein n=1 Tax=Pseudomonas sp. NPDC086112 TaxID=3364430 RepID=UPI0038214476
MMNVQGMKTRVWGQPHVFGGMRVSPLTGWNIWNMNIYKKNIYKKQIDSKHHLISSDRNTLEHAGTTFHLLFQKCSAISICRNTSQPLVDQGLQRNSRKSCSAMFRLKRSNTNHAGSPINRGLAAINF